MIINRSKYAKSALSSYSEAPKLTQQKTAIYSTRLASQSKKETKVIPPDCFF